MPVEAGPDVSGVAEVDPEAAGLAEHAAVTGLARAGEEGPAARGVVPDVHPAVAASRDDEEPELRRRRGLPRRVPASVRRRRFRRDAVRAEVGNARLGAVAAELEG